MKAFALALALVGVEASYSYPSYGHGYGQSHGYGYPSYGHQGYSQQHSHGSSSHGHPSYTSTHDPWATSGSTTTTTTTSVDKTGWWSPYQQYSPIRIPYKPAGHHGTEFGICEIDTTNVDVTIQLAQRGGKAVMARTSVTSTTDPVTGAPFLADGTDLRFQVNEYGIISNSCADAGDEYNPLTEKDKMGRANPYQDPARGRIANQAVDSTGAISNTITKDILLNLTSKDSILGRSISVYDMTVDAAGALVNANPIGCCVIGRDRPPAATTTPTPSQYHHHYPSHGHGYGYNNYGYNNYGHRY